VGYYADVFPLIADAIRTDSDIQPRIDFMVNVLNNATNYLLAPFPQFDDGESNNDYLELGLILAAIVVACAIIAWFVRRHRLGYGLLSSTRSGEHTASDSEHLDISVPDSPGPLR